jgi:hypothetical protein
MVQTVSSEFSIGNFNGQVARNFSRHASGIWQVLVSNDDDDDDGDDDEVQVKIVGMRKHSYGKSNKVSGILPGILAISESESVCINTLAAIFTYTNTYT